jgi:hypothetical protein
MDALVHTNVNLLFGSERLKKPGFNVLQLSDRKNGTNGDILADFKRPGGGEMVLISLHALGPQASNC